MTMSNLTSLDDVSSAMESAPPEIVTLEDEFRHNDPEESNCSSAKRESSSPVVSSRTRNAKLCVDDDDDFHVMSFQSQPEVLSKNMKKSLRCHHTCNPDDVAANQRSKSTSNNIFNMTTADRLYSMYQRKAARQHPYTIIVYHKTMKNLALKIKEQYPMKIVLVNLDWVNFQDGWPNLALTPHDVHKMQDPLASVCFLASFHNPESVFEQFALIYAIPKMSVRNFRVVVPWFSTATMERVETLGQIATAKTLAKMLDCIPVCKSGPATITIYDIHALAEQFYFSDNVIVELKSAVFLLKQEMCKSTNHDISNISIGFPDEGAKKRFGLKFPEFPQVVMSKERLGDLGRKVVLQEGNPNGQHVVLVDDLVQTGGTLLESMKALREAGAIRISCFVTHGVFPKDSWKKFTNLDYLETFYICDTIPTTAEAVTKWGPPFKVLSIAPLLGYLLVGREHGAQMLAHEQMDTC